MSDLGAQPSQAARLVFDTGACAHGRPISSRERIRRMVAGSQAGAEFIPENGGVRGTAEEGVTAYC